jgi:hypothetical protein
MTITLYLWYWHGNAATSSQARNKIKSVVSLRNANHVAYQLVYCLSVPDDFDFDDLGRQLGSGFSREDGPGYVEFFPNVNPGESRQTTAATMAAGGGGGGSSTGTAPAAARSAGKTPTAGRGGSQRGRAVVTRSVKHSRKASNAAVPAAAVGGPGGGVGGGGTVVQTGLPPAADVGVPPVPMTGGKTPRKGRGRRAMSTSNFSSSG